MVAGLYLLKLPKGTTWNLTPHPKKKLRHNIICFTIQNFAAAKALPNNTTRGNCKPRILDYNLDNALFYLFGKDKI